LGVWTLHTDHRLVLERWVALNFTRSLRPKGNWIWVRRRNKIKFISVMNDEIRNSHLVVPLSCTAYVYTE
jgi:hypothetical protein